MHERSTFCLFSDCSFSEPNLAQTPPKSRRLTRDQLCPAYDKLRTVLIALPFVIPDVHGVAARIHSAAPLFLMTACLVGAASSGIADGATAGTNREPRRDRKL